MLINSQIKIIEDQFIARLRENLDALSGVGMMQMEDGLKQLRQLTEGKMLRGELETKFPMAKSLRVQVTPKRSGFFGKAEAALAVIGQVVVDLPSCIRNEGGDEAVTLTRLHALLNGESECSRKLGGSAVLGLFSPTGWEEVALQFVRNDPPGSGWASGTVSVILIGPAVTDLVWDTRDKRVQRYVEYFCGLTLSERRDVCRERIERALLVQEFANLETIASEQGFSLEFVKEIAKGVAAGDKDLSMKKVAGVGWVVKKKI